MEGKRHREDSGQKLSKSNSHRRKTTCQFRNARGLALRCKSAPRENKTHCSFCKEGGALLPCDKCNRSFHLYCLNMREIDVPAVAWFCSFCSPHKEKKLRDEGQRKEKEQRVKKESLLKETLSKLSSTQKDLAIRRFSKKHPQYIRQGRILYPIEDTLLSLDPTLHQIVVPPAIPKPKASHIAPQTLGDLLYICDFFSTFRPVLHLTPFTPEQLHVALTARTHSTLLKEALMSLLNLAISHLLAKESLPEAFSLDSHYSVLMFAMKDYVVLKDFMPYVYLLLFTDVLKSPQWKDLAEDNEPLAQKLVDFPLEDFFYTDYTYAEKVELLSFLINCTYDCKEVHEELTRRLEAKAQLQKDKHDIQAEIKTLEGKKNEAKAGSRAAQSYADQIAALQKNLESIALEGSDLNVRTSPIGLDRDYAEYYVFKFDQSRIYVKLPLPLDVKRVREPCESGYWYMHSSKQVIKQLQDSLCGKGLRESKLLEGLKVFQQRQQMREEEETSTASEPGQDQDPDVPMVDDYCNSESCFETTEDLFCTLVSFILAVEQHFSDYLKASSKCWEQETAVSVWRSQVEAAETIEELKPLVQDFVAKSKTPFKLRIFGEDDSADPSQDEECTYERKYRKVSLRIWQDLGETAQKWSDLLDQTQSRSEVAFMVGLLNGVLVYYMRKKPEAAPPKQKEKEAPKSTGVQTRRALKLEHKRNHPRSESSSSSDSHESVCLLCQDAGELIMCEGCPRVVHPQCIGLTVSARQQPPDEDWYCDGCQRTRDSCRITRSRTRLRKIGGV